MNVDKSIKAILYMIILSAISVASVYAQHKIGLEVDIDIKQSQINGTSKMHVSDGKAIMLQTGLLAIHEVQLDGRPVEYNVSDGTLEISPPYDGELAIKYTGIFQDQRSPESIEHSVQRNVISERSVSLAHIWYPVHAGLSYHDLKATFPMGYNAVSEAETVKKVNKHDKVEYHFSFPHKVGGINLVASDKYIVVKDKIRKIEIWAFFFSENIGLAKRYIEFTKKYLQFYEDLIGRYPFKRFSIVENVLPTGYSMPTFTLLGSSVIKLPFIAETSLGHEILHQWFGNSVYIDYDSGNWAEGLTTYLADHLYKEQAGKGWEYRKQILIDYKSYMREDRDMPLKHFRGGTDRPSRAAVYGKTAMVFHMLKMIVGEKAFFRSLKDFIEDNRFKRASWDDIKESFSKMYVNDLDGFFRQWTEEEGLPELTLHGVELRQIGSEFKLHFHLDQEGGPFQLDLPLTIYFKDSVLTDSIFIDYGENSFDLVFQNRPYKIVLDELYDVARGLQREEFPPVIARLMGDDNITIALPEAGIAQYQKIIHEFEGKGAVAKAVHDIKISDVESGSLLILGIDNPLIGRIFGAIEKEDAGFYVAMKNNPWNPEKVVAVMHGKSRREVEKAFGKIPHYGKYSKLLFADGFNIGKEIQETKKGIVMNLHHESPSIEVSSIKTLSDVIKGISDKKIIYVGEVHDVFAHHAVQLDIITGIYKDSPKIAIGMEMFQRPFQEALDKFIYGKTGETAFLKQSEYFKRWGFDYMLYKPILDFARTEQIPVIALNLQREIIEKVSRNGLDSLSKDEKTYIPPELDFSDNEYRERLKEVFSMHKNKLEKDFNYFYQSQILWDETMSHSVDLFLKDNPDYKIIVLAGQGHLQYGSGIPGRTFRRNGHDYAIVLIDDKVEKGIADYVVFPKPVEGVTSPKLMLFLNMDNTTVKVAGFPEQSISEKAGIRVNDIILFLDDVEIKSIEDIRIYLLSKRRGDILKVKILRKEKEEGKEMEIEVEL